MLTLKRLKFIIAAAVIIICQLLPCVAFAVEIQSREEVVIGYYEIEGFYEVDNETGAKTGYGFEYLENIAKKAQWNVRYEKAESFGQCVQWLRSGKIDIFGPIHKTDEREEFLSFADYESGTSCCALFVKEDNLTYAANDYKVLDGIKIGYLSNDYRVDCLNEFAIYNSFTFKAYEYESLEQMVEAVGKGDIDAILLSTLNNLKGYRIIARFNPQPFYFATSKEDIKIALDNALNRIKSENPYYDLELHKKYYGNKTDSYIVFTSYELSYLRSKPTVTVVYDPYWFPLSYKNNDDEYAGFMRKIFNLIQDSLTLSDGSGYITFKFYDASPYGNLLDGFNSGKYDILSAYALGQSTNLQSNAKFTDVILSSSVLLVENPHLMQGKMYLPRNYYLSKLGTSLYQNEYEIVYVDTIEECFKALKNNEAKYTIVNTYIASIYLDRADYMFLNTTAITGVSEDVSIAVYKETPEELFTLIQKAVDYISANEKNELLRDTLLESTTYSLRDWMYRNPEEFFTIITVFGTFLLSAVIAVLFIQRKSKKDLYNMLIFDKLTGLYVKEGFFIEASKKIKTNPNILYAIIHFNLVQFKIVNELFGYNSGDELLKYCAKLVTDFAGSDAVCARTEGDHYLICMPYSKVDMRMISIIEEKLSDFQKSIHINAKAGVYVVDNRELPISAMYDRALLALKEAQKMGDRKYFFYDERLKNAAVEEQEILTDFASALANKEFVVYYQPIVSLTEKRAVSAEALVRWIHPTKGMISPGVFIPILENNGLIAQLDYYVWEEVFKYARKRIDGERMPITYSINLSRVHLYSTKFIDVLSALATKYDIPPEIVHVEVTETAYTKDTKYFPERLNLLKKKGFKVVMDDFGSGFSSLNTLSDFPIDIVKLDIAFFTAKKKARANSIVMSTIQMLHNIGMSVVAEGVETKEQAELLYSLGCDSIQGYYFYKPMNIEDFERADNSQIEIGSAEIMKNRSKIQMDLSQLKNIENFKGMDTLVEAIPCGFGVLNYNHETMICHSVFLSEGIESFLGYENNEAYELSKKNIVGIVHPDDLGIIYEGLQTALAERKFFEKEFRLKASNGDYKWLSFRANAVEKEDSYSLWYGVFTNIDSYRKANEELIRVNAFYKTIYDTMLCGVAQFETNKPYSLISINQAGSTIFGYASTEDCLQNFDLNNSTFEQDQEYRDSIFRQAYETGNPVSFEYRVIRPDRCVTWIRGAVHYVKAGNSEWYQSSFIESNEKIATGE